jgi:hypothetical protein
MSTRGLGRRALFAFVGLTVVAAFVLVGCEATKKTEPETQASTATSAKPAPQASEDVVIYTCPMHPEVISNEPGECPTCGMKLVPESEVAKVQSDTTAEQMALYTCPMHPEVQAHGPGKCPTCGMDLVPVEAGTNPGATATKEM